MTNNLEISDQTTVSRKIQYGSGTTQPTSGQTFTMQLCALPNVVGTCNALSGGATLTGSASTAAAGTDFAIGGNYAATLNNLTAFLNGASGDPIFSQYQFRNDGSYLYVRNGPYYVHFGGTWTNNEGSGNVTQASAAYLEENGILGIQGTFTSTGNFRAANGSFGCVGTISFGSDAVTSVYSGNVNLLGLTADPNIDVSTCHTSNY